MSLNESLRCFSAFFNSLVNRRVLEESEKKTSFYLLPGMSMIFFVLGCHALT